MENKNSPKGKVSRQKTPGKSLSQMSPLRKALQNLDKPNKLQVQFSGFSPVTSAAFLDGAKRDSSYLALWTFSRWIGLFPLAMG